METDFQIRNKVVTFLEGVAGYFSEKTANEITFEDADNYDHEIFRFFQEWQENFPETPFEKEFPCFDKLWEELATWNAQDGWIREKSERIVSLAKEALEEVKAYQKNHDK